MRVFVYVIACVCLLSCLLCRGKCMLVFVFVCVRLGKCVCARECLVVFVCVSVYVSVCVFV